MRHPYTPQQPTGVSVPPALPFLVPFAQRRTYIRKAEGMLAFNRTSRLVNIHVRSGRSRRLDLRLQELVQAGQIAPSYLCYELHQANGGADL